MSSRSTRLLSRRALLQGLGFGAAGVAGSVLLSACGASRRSPEQAADSAGTQPVAARDDGRPRIFCYVEVLTADRPSVYGYMAPLGCVPASAFKQGERIVWRFVVMDTRAGQQLSGEGASKVALRLSTGEETPADYKQRGEGQIADAPWTWDACWDVPLDYPIGALDYAVHVTFKDGSTGSWSPPALVDQARGIDTRPRIIPKELPTNPERTT